jgi:hypothetical protein
MTREFDDWWNADNMSKDNPWKKDSPAFWAWEGWHTAQKVEREACAKLCEEMASWHGNLVTAAFECAADAIRKRGQE